MIKVLCLLLLCLHLPLYGGSFELNRSFEGFRSLSEKQKNEFITHTMELVASVESRYQFEVAKYGYNSERELRFKQTLEKIASLFIDSAEAKVDPWEEMARDFEKLRKDPADPSKGYCILAGWVSRPYVSKKDNKTYCAHPQFIGSSKTKSPESYAYPAGEQGDCGKDDKTKIYCSPLIFGYKSEKDRSLFCVDAKAAGKNSSYACMQNALSGPDKHGGDSKSERLKNLRNRLSSNPEVFKLVQEFIYQTCLCPSSDEKHNKDYQEGIRPGRTCFGLMEMISSTALDCHTSEVSPLSVQDTTIFSNLRAFIGLDAYSSGKAADAQYQQFLQEEMKKNPAEYSRVCGNQAPLISENKPESVPTQKTEEEKKQTEDCLIDPKAPILQQDTRHCHSPHQITNSLTNYDLTKLFAPKPEGKTKAQETALLDYIKENTPPGDASNSKTEQVAKLEIITEPQAPLLASKPETKPQANTQPETKSELGPSTVTITQNEAKKELKVLVQMTPETSPEVIAQTDLQKQLKPQLTPLKATNSPGPVANDGENSATEEAPSENEEEKTDEESEKKSDEDPKLEVKTKLKTDSNITLEALITGNSKGWNLNWEIQASEKLKVIKSWEKKSFEKPVEIKGLPKDGSEEETEAPKEPVLESHPKSIVQTRLTEDYKVCGTLSKGDKKIGPVCGIVPKIEVKKIVAPANFVPNSPPPPPPQTPMRGLSDTSAWGIR